MKAPMSTTLYCQRLTGAYRVTPHSLPFYFFPSLNLSQFQYSRSYATSTESLPRVVQPSLWNSIIPKAFRNSEPSRVQPKPPRTKEWNPATFFICIFLLIGSNAIQMLALKNEYSTFSRKADAKIKLLKDVLDRVQRGENVDVEKALGTGDEQQEQEWKDVLRHIEEEASTWIPKDRKWKKRRPQDEEAEANNTKEVAEQKNTDDKDSGDSEVPSQSAQQSDFY